MARLRRWRYLPAAVVAVWAAAGLTTTTTTAQDVDPDAFAVKCWRVETTSTGSTLAVVAVDDACPVAVEIADLTAPFAPGDDVPAIWTVTLKSALETTNALAMPLPPPYTYTSDSATARPAQISATYVRACTTVASCDPSSVADTSSAVQTSNFSASGEPLSFSTIQGLTFATEGVFPIAAFVAVQDAVDVGVAYVFAAYATVTVKATPAAEPSRTPGVVRCRMTRQSALNATLDAVASVSESSSCELRVALAPLQIVRPNDAAPVRWVATLDRRDEADIHLPLPLTAIPLNETETETYEIVASYVKLCSDDASVSCDEYTSLASLEAVASAGPASFSPSGNVTFTSAPVTLATPGRHSAMLHMVLAGSSRRYDFTYYFELLATPAEIVPAQSYNPTAETPTAYCWDVLADATSSNVTAASVAAEANASACPYVSILSLPTTTLTADAPFNVSWSLTANPLYSALASPLATTVTLWPVYDPVSKSYVSLPTLNVYACGTGTACTPFSSDKTLLRALPARSLDTNGSATITADGLTLPSDGNYTLMVHSVFPNGASRVDTASFAAVSVARAPTPAASEAPVTEEATSHTVTYIVVAVVCVVAVAVVVVGGVWFRRRRQRQRMDKMVQFGLFGAPATRGTVMHNTDSRGSFQSGEDGRGSFSFLRVQASQPSPMGLETPRDGSLSYDPYQRPSFQEMSFAESSLSFAFTENERPSNLTHDSKDGVDV